MCASLAAGLAMAAPAAQAIARWLSQVRRRGCGRRAHAMHHGIRGFVAGCAAGMYRRHLYNKQMREQKMAPKAMPAPVGGAPAHAM